MTDLTLYHNPRCSKSRGALELLEARGLTPTVVRYLETPLSAAQLREVVAEVGRYEEFCFDTETTGFDIFNDRIVGLSQGGEVFEPIIKDWADLDNLELPDLDNPAYYEGARELGASGTDLFRVGGMPGWPFATCRYMRKMEVYFMDLLAFRDQSLEARDVRGVDPG